MAAKTEKLNELKRSKYVLSGTVGAEKDVTFPAELPLNVYAVRDGEVLGTAPLDPKKKGEFSIRFSRPEESPLGINIVVAPAVPQQYYPEIITRTGSLDTLFHQVPALGWERRDGFHYSVDLRVSAALIEQWLVWMRPFRIHGVVKSNRTQRGVGGALVEVFEVNTLPGGGYSYSCLGSATSGLHCGNYYISFPWFAFVLFPSGLPDLIFRVSLNINGVQKVVYQEDASKTRWNVSYDSHWNLWIDDDEGTSINDPWGQFAHRPGDQSFLFTRVGLISADRIAASGYADARQGVSGNVPIGVPGGTVDAPFGRSLDICGWFGEMSDVTHFKLISRKDGGSPVEVTDPIANQYYDFVKKSWIPVAMGPFSIGGVNNLYTTPYLLDKVLGLSRPWYFPDLLVRWDTTRAGGDGLYRLGIAGYRQAGNTVSPAAALVSDPAYGTIYLRVDNTAPDSRILAVRHDQPLHNPPLSHPVAACAIEDIADTDTITVNARAFDASGHLRGYSLAAMYGHNCSVSPAPANASGSYNPSIASHPVWSGGDYTISYPMSQYGKQNGSCIPGKMPSCAYQFRFSVSKRTTNGYGLIYTGVEDTMHVTIRRP